jgi:hypothetical protein
MIEDESILAFHSTIQAAKLPGDPCSLPGAHASK